MIILSLKCYACSNYNRIVSLLNLGIVSCPCTHVQGCIQDSGLGGEIELPEILEGQRNIGAYR